MDILARIFILLILFALITYFVRKELLNEGLTALYLLLSIITAAIIEILRIVSSIVDIELGKLIFRVSLIGIPITSLLLLLFMELLLYGKNQYFRHTPIYIILGMSIRRMLTVEIEPVGKGLQRDYTYQLPLELIIYSLTVVSLFILYSTLLVIKVSKRFKLGLRSGFLKMIVSYNAFMFLAITLLATNVVFKVRLVNERYLFALIGSTMQILLVLIIAFYPRTLALVPLKLHTIQLFEKNNKIELYSIAFTNKTLETDMQLVNQFISAMMLFTKEALRGGYIKSIEMEYNYMFFEVSEHFIAVAITKEYHYNVKIILKNILNHAEKLIKERKDLLKQLSKQVIEVEKWREALEDKIRREVFPI